MTPLVGGGRLYQLPHAGDARGNLRFGAVQQSLPFPAVRYDLVFGPPSPEVPGGHAHRGLDGFLIATHRSCAVRLFDGARSEKVALASDLDCEADCIRDRDEYLALVAAQGGSAFSR